MKAFNNPVLCKVLFETGVLGSKVSPAKRGKIYFHYNSINK